MPRISAGYRINIISGRGPMLHHRRSLNIDWNEKLALNRAVILAMQSVGAAMGNMVCINNIVAVCSILGIANREGYILKRTVVPMVLYGIVAAVAGGIIVAMVS